jgi:hypothetical protein
MRSFASSPPGLRDYLTALAVFDLVAIVVVASMTETNPDDIGPDGTVRLRG